MKRKIQVAMIVAFLLFLLFENQINIAIEKGRQKRIILNGEIVNKRMHKWRNTSKLLPLLYISTNDSIFVDRRTYNLTEIEDYIIKEKGSMRYTIIRANDTFYFYPIYANHVLYDSVNVLTSMDPFSTPGSPPGIFR